MLNKTRLMRSKRLRHKSKPRRKSSKNKSIYIILFIVIILIYLFIQGDQGFLKYIKLQQEKKQILKQIERLKKEYNDSLNEIDLLTNNYRYIEKIAREQHQMGKKGEKIYIITPPKK